MGGCHPKAFTCLSPFYRGEGMLPAPLSYLQSRCTHSVAFANVSSTPFWNLSSYTPPVPYLNGGWVLEKRNKAGTYIYLRLRLRGCAGGWCQLMRGRPSDSMMLGLTEFRSQVLMLVITPSSSPT